jgi:hypothetical protein
MTAFFYQHEQIGIEYTHAGEIYDFLTEHSLSVDEWREAMYKVVQTPLAWGELRSAREIYDMILEVYDLAHKATREGSSI